MKVFATPVPFEDADLFAKDWEAKEIAHSEKLKAHLIEMGYTGKYTGEIISRGVADGAARYMMADGKGRYGPSFLVHLPYGDAYQARDIQYVPKKELIAEIERFRRFEKTMAKTKTKKAK